MNISFPELNYASVFIAAVAMLALQMFWYGPLFGRSKALKGRIAKSQGYELLDYILMFVGSLFVSYVLSYFFGVWWAGEAVDQAFSGAYYGVLAWLGFALPVTYWMARREGKSTQHLLIDLGYYFLAFAMTGIIIALGTQSVLNAVK